MDETTITDPEPAEVQPTIVASPVEAAKPTAEKTTSAWEVLALVLGLGGMAAGVGLAAVVALVLSLSPAGQGLDLVAAVTILGLGLLGAPLAWQAGQALRGRPPLAWQPGTRWLIVGGVVVVASLLGGQVSLSLNFAPGVLIGAAQYLALLGAVAMLVGLIAGGWDGFSRLRAWGHFISGAWLGVIIAFIAEVVVIGVLAVAGVALLAVLAPDEFERLTRLFRTFQQTLDLDQLMSLALQPWAIVMIVIVGSGLLPAIEELLKPLGVMLMLRRRPTPMAAFLGGALGGVGFAVVESLSNLSTIQEGWLALVVARIGTTIMHGLTAGLVGWGWGQLAATRKPWRLVASYLTAVAIHGLWNGAVIAVSFGSVSLMSPETDALQKALLVSLMLVSVAILIGLTLGGLATLGVIGYRLRKA